MVYHHLLTEELSKEIERLQDLALKMIYPGASGRERKKKSGLATLKERREISFQNFANKIKNSEQFSKQWLIKNDPLSVSLRRRITRSNFDRLKNGPINKM